MWCYFVLLVTLWLRPLEDYVFVGVDWTPTTEVPPQSQKEIWRASNARPFSTPTHVPMNRFPRYATA